MPHVNSSGGEDLASSDEVKVYKDEGEEEKKSSENLSEDKLGLVTETEEDKHHSLAGQGYPGGEKHGNGRQDDKNVIPPHPADRGGIGHVYMGLPYHYPNGASVPSSLGAKVSMVQPPYPQFMVYNNEHFTSPPPAHMGIPPVHIDPKTGLPRPPMYALPPPGQFPHPVFSPDFSQVQCYRPPGYPITSSALGSPYPPSLMTSSPLSRFAPPGLITPPVHHGINHPAIVTPGPKQDLLQPSLSQENHRHGGPHDSGNQQSTPEPERKKPHIKKPLNAFMLFMKEMRAKVVAECTLKESAAINQILGRRWHALDRSEQAKYYEMARKEKELHMQLYPGWSARDNYASHTKKKKRKKEGPGETKDSLILGNGTSECTNPKKCRARFGVDGQSQWCKPCRRKKKCIRFLQGEDGYGSSDCDEDMCSYGGMDSIHGDSDSNMGSPQPSLFTGQEAGQDMCGDGSLNGGSPAPPLTRASPLHHTNLMMDTKPSFT
ncbi:protein pangolin, isoforms A/H/I/S-like isoform X2 [Liolophura sinensis]|uniref:protein pangolin, isoforms A/H/I/S-like isoform X2 n=1 Tax=Liolophura sinensis TaxID=3198878 RepID=UPI003158ECDE